MEVLRPGDFIKTSTGKTSLNATLGNNQVMIEAIRDFYLDTAVPIGMKPARAAIRTAIKQSLQFLIAIKETLGDAWLTPRRYRFGASSLLNDLLRQIERERTGAYQAPYTFSEAAGELLAKWPPPEYTRAGRASRAHLRRPVGIRPGPRDRGPEDQGAHDDLLHRRAPVCPPPLRAAISIPTSTRRTSGSSPRSRAGRKGRRRRGLRRRGPGLRPLVGAPGPGSAASTSSGSRQGSCRTGRGEFAVRRDGRRRQADPRVALISTS